MFLSEHKRLRREQVWGVNQMVHLTSVKIRLLSFSHLTRVFFLMASELSLSIDVTVLQGLW